MSAAQVNVAADDVVDVNGARACTRASGQDDPIAHKSPERVTRGATETGVGDDRRLRPDGRGGVWGGTPRCEIEPLLVASMATTLLEGLVSSALAGNELFESFFRAAGPCLLVEAWRDAGAPRAFDGTALPGWSPDAGHLVATRSPSMKCVPVVSEPSVPYCTS